MTIKYWVGDVNSDFEVTNNWSTSSGGVGNTTKPGASDDAVLDGAGTGNIACTLSAAIATISFSVTAGYSATLDFNDFNVTCSGDMTFAGTGTAQTGTGTIECAGNFNISGQTTWTAENGLLKLTGSGKTLTGKGTATSVAYALEVTGSITTGANLRIWGATSTISGTFTINHTIRWWRYLTFSGTIQGTGTVSLYCQTLTNSGGGVWSVATTNNYAVYAELTISAGMWGGNWTFFKSEGTTMLFTGNCVFTSDVTFNCNTAGTFTLNFATYDVSLEFQGAVDLLEVDGTATLVWSKAATGAVTFGGTTTYTDSTAAIQNLGDVGTADGASLTLATEMETDDLTIAQNSTIAGAFLFDVAGNFVINGASGNTVSWTNADLAVTGTAVAHYANVTDSDASGGTEITASDNCNSYGTNTNWNFGAAGFDGPTTYHLGADVTPRTVYKLQPA